jgi:hypothetical protein
MQICVSASYIECIKELFHHKNATKTHSHNDDTVPSSVGIVFSNLFAERISVSRFRSIPISIGIVPESPLVSNDNVAGLFLVFSAKRKSEWHVSRRQLDSHPHNKRILRLLPKLVARPISDGIVPTRPAPAATNDSIGMQEERIG